MADFFLPSEADKEAIQRLLRESNQRIARRTGPDDNLRNDITTPEMYVVRAPGDGIPGLVPNTTGTASQALEDDEPGMAEDCEIYRINNEGDTPVMEKVDEISVTVYNLSENAVAAGSWATVQRDKFGTWYVTSAAVFTENAIGYVARTPSGGIDGLDENTTGTGTQFDDDVAPFAECDFFTINDDGTLADAGIAEDVYNVGTVEIPGDIWVAVVKQANGKWVAIPPAFDSEGFLDDENGTEDCPTIPGLNLSTLPIVDATTGTGPGEGQLVYVLGIDENGCLVRILTGSCE